MNLRRLSSLIVADHWSLSRQMDRKFHKRRKCGMKFFWVPVPMQNKRKLLRPQHDTAREQTRTLPPAVSGKSLAMPRHRPAAMRRHRDRAGRSGQAAALRGHSRADAIRAPSTRASSFAHATSVFTSSPAADVAKPQSLLASTLSRPTMLA